MMNAYFVFNPTKNSQYFLKNFTQSNTFLGLEQVPKRLFSTKIYTFSYEMAS